MVELINLLNKYNKVDLVTENGITVMSIDYINALTDDKSDTIYLVVYGMCDKCVKLNYKSIKRTREWNEEGVIELTI